MKTAIAVSLLSLTINAHAGSNAQGPHGGIAAARGLGHGPGASSFGAPSAAPGQSGQGGKYDPAGSSMVDAYQPWSEASMRQYQKPRWEPYAGD